jgi:GT2 family glycosyltransferase
MKGSSQIKLDLCIVVVSYNSKATLEKCIESIYRYSPVRHSFEVVLVDNNSTDINLTDFEKDFPELNIIRNSENLGFGVANNIGMASMPAKYYYLHNSDAYLKSNVLDPALDILDDNDDVGIGGIPLVFPDLSPQTAAYSFSKPIKWILQSFGIDKIVKRIAVMNLRTVNNLLARMNIGRSFINTYGNQSSECVITSVDWVCGAAMLIRNATKNDLGGGFDENIFLYGEDEDICIEAKKKGWKVGVLAVDSVIHDFGWENKNKQSKQVVTYKYNSLVYFINKHFSELSISWLVMRALLLVKKFFWNL